MLEKLMRKKIIILIIILAVLESFTIYSYKSLVSYAVSNYQENIEEQKERYWDLIFVTLKENVDKAEIQVTCLTEKIEKQLIDAYQNDFDRFRYDIENPTNQCPFIKLSRELIEDVYLNVKNDNNDPMISTRFGVGPDLSKNCASTGQSIRTWDEEISKHANKELVKKAIDDIQNSNMRYTIWEFLESTNPNHKMITRPSVFCLKEVFYEEGLKGLETYEILVSVHITPNGDLTGIPDVSGLGNKNQNHKVNITQGFNLYDRFITEHNKEIYKYEQDIKRLKKQFTKSIRVYTFIFVVLGVFLFLSVIMMMLVYNKSLNNEYKYSVH